MNFCFLLRKCKAFPRTNLKEVPTDYIKNVIADLKVGGGGAIRRQVAFEAPRYGKNVTMSGGRASFS